MTAGNRAGPGVIARVGSIARLAAESHLPSTIRFRLRELPDALPAELQALVARAQTNGTAHGYRLEVEQAQALPVLRELVRHPQRLESLIVSEPGLEDLFRMLNAPAQEPSRGGGGEG